MAEAVAAVRVDISAETAKLQEGVKKAQAILRQLQGSAGGIEAAFTRVGNMLAGAFAVSSIVNFIGHAVEAGAKIDDLADQAGLSAEKFQELSFALRNSGVDQEKMSVAFATFGRNLSDLNRGTGTLLDFTRRFAPALGEQLKGVTDTSEGFKILADFISRLTDKTDQLRVGQAGGGRQMVKMAVEAGNLGSSLQTLMDQYRASGRVMSTEQVHELEVASQAWKDLGNAVVIATGKMIAAISLLSKEPPPDTAQLLASAARLKEIISRLTEGTALWKARVQELEQIQNRLNDAIGRGLAASTTVTPAPDTSGLEKADRIKAAQANLQLLQSRLQAIPPVAFQMGAAFQAAFGQAAAVINLTADAKQRGALISAASNQMRQQAYQAYVAALGASFPLQDQYRIKVDQINLAVADQAQRILALSQANLDYQMGLLNLATSMGAVISPLEQYRMKLEQINQTIAANPELANRAAGAQTKAAATMVATYAGAASEVASNLSQMFQKNKGLAAAAAIISGLAGAARAIEIYGPTPWGWAAAASAAALGVANAAKIMSQSESGSGSGASATPTAQNTEPAQQGPQQSFTINLTGETFSRQQVQDLIGRINDEQKNGTVLIATKVAA